MTHSDEQKNISEYAAKVLSLARDAIIVRFRFFDRALAAIELVEDDTLTGYVSDIGRLSYNPAKLLRDFRDDENFAVRLLLHVIFHNIFMHFSRKDIANRDYWDRACDIAVENAVLSTAGEYTRLPDTEVQLTLSKLGKWVPRLTAEYLYREFMVGGISSDSAEEYARLFSIDIHYHRPEEEKRDEIVIPEDQWEKIARRVAAELKSFSRDIRGAETMLINLGEGMRKTYDYDDIVRRFAVMSEEIRVSPDEFDYIYYSYGLSRYGNMPLIEPLEYTDEKKIREFIIAVDTSASVRGQMVEGFLTRTYDLLTQSGAFSENMNVHVIQCDSDVTNDTVITDRNDLGHIAKDLQVKGFGATDFRPVFEYVGDMIARKEFRNLKGLIYFTDGYGTFPNNPPDYDAAFIFLDQGYELPEVPVWAIKMILKEDEIQQF